MERKTIRFVSVYRFLALVIVLYYHLVQMPTYSNTVLCVINGTLDSTIIPGNLLAPLGLKIFNHFHMDTGSLAVTMFFVASGYLTSKMMDRYTRKEYLINRAIGTFPTLWVSIAVICLTVYFSQGITFSASDILGSAFPFWPKYSGMFVSAVLWTLRVEMKFYLFAAIFGKNRKKMVFYGYATILLLTIICQEFNSYWIYPQMLDFQFMSFAFLGIIIELVEREKCEHGLLYIITSVIFNILLFKISTDLFQDSASRMSYPSVVTQVLPVALFLLLRKLENRFPKFYDRIPKFVYASGKLLLPIYLTHVACGITVMYWMNVAGCSPYLTVLGGVVASFVVAWVIYRLVQKPSGVLMKKVIARMRQNELR